jgi:predicted alpha/beta hydrolase family esterase
MKASDTDILMIPGLGDSGPEHWQSRWEAKLSTARRVVQDDWDAPDREAWIDRIADSVATATRPVVLVAHSLGVAAAIAAVQKIGFVLRGALLVAPPDFDNPALAASPLKEFGPYSRDPLPFPSITVASNNDPYCTIDVAQDLALAWGSLFIDAGEAGHINAESGYGPWPEGSFVLGKLLQRI